MPQGNAAAVLIRRQRIEELLGEGLESAVKIAERLVAEGIKASERTVRNDIVVIGKDWHASIVDMRHVRQMRKVRDAERRNVALQKEWERSQLDKKRNRTKATEKGTGEIGDDGKPVPGSGTTEAEEVTEGRIGDVAMMAEQRKNDEFVARLLGLEEPKQVDVTSGGQPVTVVAGVDLQAVIGAKPGLPHDRVGTGPK